MNTEKPNWDQTAAGQLVLAVESLQEAIESAFEALERQFNRELLSGGYIGKNLLDARDATARAKSILTEKLK